MTVQPAAVAQRRTWNWVLRASGLLILAAVVGIALHLGELEAFARLARQARPEWLLAALALQILTYVANARIWFLTLARAGVPRTMRSLVPLCVSKLFADQAFPTGGVSGSVFVVGRLGQEGVPASAAMAALLVGMLGYYTAYALLAVCVLLLLSLRHHADPAAIGVVAIFVCAMAAIPALVLWLRRFGSDPPRWAARLPGSTTLLRAVADTPRDLLYDRRLVAQAAALQGLIFLLDSATLWVMLFAVGRETPPDIPLIAFVMASIAATLSPLPLGLGTFEAVCTATLRLLGVPVEAGLTATLLLRGFTFWLPMIPGLWLARSGLRTEAA